MIDTRWIFFPLILFYLLGYLHAETIPSFNEDADRRWKELRTPPHISLDDASGSARVMCRTFQNSTQKRFSKIIRHFWVYDALVTDVDTGTRVLIESSDTREAAIERATDTLVEKLISTGKMTESTSCLVPPYSAPLVLIRGNCPPGEGIQCDTVCEFACRDPGFTLIGSSFVECHPNQSLFYDFPKCQVASSSIIKTTLATDGSATIESRSTKESSVSTDLRSSFTTQSAPPTSALPQAEQGIKTFGYLGFLGVPLLLLPTIFLLSKLRHKKQYDVLDENAEEDDMDDVPPDVDGLYHNHISPAFPTVVQLNHAECYAMDQRNKGLVFILNNYIFRSDHIIKRVGSDIDVANVRHVFTEIGYTTEEAHNLTAAGIREKLQSLIRKISPSDSSVVLVFMSHGVPEGILGTDQKVVTVEEIKEMFSGKNCTALIGKPKIMIFQACRGVYSAILPEGTRIPRTIVISSSVTYALDCDNLTNWYLGMDKATPSAPSQPPSDEDAGLGSTEHDSLAEEREEDAGVVMDTDDAGSLEAPGRDGGDADVDYNVPDNADVYIAHATSEGYFSIRDKVNGSWFIQALCEELIVSAHVDDLDTIMTKVTRRVKRLEAKIMYQGRKQTTLQTPQIIKQGIEKMIYFLPKYPSASSSP